MLVLQQSRRGLQIESREHGQVQLANILPAKYLLVVLEDGESLLSHSALHGAHP